MEVSKEFIGVSIVFNSVLRCFNLFQESFKKIFKVFPKSFKFCKNVSKIIVALHSSQLPKQKEGLFSRHKNYYCMDILMSQIILSCWLKALS